jgi:hypothetical protein
MEYTRVDSEEFSQSFVSSQSSSLELLIELGRATTAYHEALPECAELARQEYEDALSAFKRLTANEKFENPCG